MSSKDLFTAELAIYAVLCLPALYLLWRHGWPGIFGWFYLFAFCSLRVVGGAMVTNNSQSSSANIVSSIGISPLLLTVDGILHEAKVYRNPNLNKMLEWTFIVFIHVLVATGIAMVAVGFTSLYGDNPKPSDLTMLKVGMGLLTACWVILDISAIASLLPSQHRKDTLGHLEGTVLLSSVLAGLVFVGIRVLYSLIAECTQKPDLNPITGSLAVRIVLSFLPELIAILLFLFAGWQTRDIRKYGKMTREQEEMRKRRANHNAHV